jgi:hypothetical protein
MQANVAILLQLRYIDLHKDTFYTPEGFPMFTTTQLDNGILNNYAVEPEVYFAAYPSPEQQQRYALQGAMATLLVSTLVLVALAVS